MISEKRKEDRKQMFDKMEKQLLDGKTPEDDLFYHHPSEDHIVLTHAIFWVMSRSIGGRLAKEKFFLLLRQFQEEMLDAYLMDDDYFLELLRYCNIMYNTLPYILPKFKDKSARKLSAIAVVARGYGGDLSDDKAYELLDDIDFYYNKVKCRKIEQILPLLNRYVEDEMNF